MSSWYSHLSDAIKRRVGRYLINRYLGPYLEEGILLDQLSVASGPVRLDHVVLNTRNINAMLEDSEVSAYAIFCLRQQVYVMDFLFYTGSH